MELSHDQKRQLLNQQLLNVAAAHYELFLSHGSFEASGDSDLAAGANEKMDKMEKRKAWLEGQLDELANQ